jgi:hypothetical protein
MRKFWKPRSVRYVEKSSLERKSRLTAELLRPETVRFVVKVLLTYALEQPIKLLAVSHVAAS